MLSGLSLDQELTEGDLWRLARVAAASGYGDDELSDIHWNEVAPVVARNLLAPTGVWSGLTRTGCAGGRRGWPGDRPRICA